MSAAPKDDWIFHFIEQHYLAEQADLLLQQSLEERSPRPLRDLVERLVLEGPHNLPALQLVLQVVARRRNEVEEDAGRLWQDLGALLHSKGLHLPAISPWEALPLQPDHLRQRMAPLRRAVDQAALEEGVQAFLNAQSVLQDLYHAWNLLHQLEEELEGWAWGLARLTVLPTFISERIL